jgi:hypothetical protein
VEKIIALNVMKREGEIKRMTVRKWGGGGGGKTTGNEVVMHGLWKPALPRKGEVNLNENFDQSSKNISHWLCVF